MIKSCLHCGGTGYLPADSKGFSFLRKCHCQLECEECANSGYQEVIQDGYRFLKPCRCQLIDQVIRRYNLALIPEKYGPKTVENFEIDPYDRKIAFSQRDVLNTLNRYIKTFDLQSKGIILYGTYGVGKTHLLIGLLKELIINHGVSGLYIDFPQWVKQYKNQLMAGGDATTSPEVLRAVDILVIDEFGRILTEYEMGIFESIFTERYNRSKIMLIGTNYEMTKNSDGTYMGEILSPALFSRLGDFSTFEAMKLSGEDYRLR